MSKMTILGVFGHFHEIGCKKSHLGDNREVDSDFGPILTAEQGGSGGTEHFKSVTTMV